MHKKILLGLLIFGLVHTIHATPILDDYELTDEVANGALEGWELYKQGKTVCRYDGGAYADQNLEYGGNQFWTNGGYARYDRDQNGHLETVFLIVGNDLEYFGSIGSKDRFVHVSNKRQEYLNQPFEQFMDSYRERRSQKGQNAPLTFGSSVPSGKSVAQVNDQIVGDPGLGKRRSAVCAACHMVDGNSVNPLWPKLAGQHARYLEKQLKDFKSGVRHDPIMLGQVAALSEEDVVNLAAYYSPLPRKMYAAQHDEKISYAGKQIYEYGIAEISTPGCIECHGPAGMGNVARGVPVVAGQHAVYIEKQLKQFRYAAQHSATVSSSGRSNDANQQMRQVLNRMSDAEIRDVAQYIQGMKPRL